MIIKRKKYIDQLLISNHDNNGILFKSIYDFMTKEL